MKDAITPLGRMATSLLTTALLMLANVTHAEIIEDATNNLNGTSDVGIRGICGELRDAPKGLYGLCAAFCEVNDYVALLDPTATVAPPNPRILSRFESINADAGTDFAMPCLVRPTEDNYNCPVIGPAQYEAMRTPTEGLVRVDALTEENAYFDAAQRPSLTDKIIRTSSVEGVKATETITISVQAYRSSASATPYAYVGTWSKVKTGVETETVGGLTYLTPAQFLGCRELIVNTDIPPEG